MKQIEELYNTYFHDVYLYIRALSHSDDIAEEITQDTFFRAMKSIDRFKGDCDIRVWLCQIAKNTFYTRCRQQARFSGDGIPETATDERISLEDAVADQEQAVRIHQILHGMAEPYKEVFTLRALGDVPYAQIASLFSKSESWARVTYHRARLLLTERMNKEESK